MHTAARYRLHWLVKAFELLETTLDELMPTRSLLARTNSITIETDAALVHEELAVPDVETSHQH